MGFVCRSITPTSQIWKDQKWREEKRREGWAAVLRPLYDVVGKITIESRAMSEERDQKGRLSTKSVELVLVGITDSSTAKTWDVILSVGQVEPLM